MTDDFTRQRSRRKAPAKLKKPRKDFPLNIHKGSGCWCKKVRGRVHYFGKIADDPKGVAALEKWLEDKDDLFAGREPRAKSDGLTVAELSNEFLSLKESLRDNGELTPARFVVTTTPAQPSLRRSRRTGRSPIWSRTTSASTAPSSPRIADPFLSVTRCNGSAAYSSLGLMKD